MKLVFLLLLSVIPILLSFYPGTARAQIVPVILQDGLFVPVHHEQIRMDSELVIMRLNWKSYTVDSVFHFYNTGDTTKAWVGIRKVGSGSAVRQVPGHVGWAKYDFISFDAWINGLKVKFTEAPGQLPHVGTDHDSPTPLRYREKYGWMMVKELAFPGHAVTTIRVRYEVDYGLGPSTNSCGYKRSVGRYWNGKIGRSVFIIDGSLIGGLPGIENSGLADSRKISANLMTYEQVDYEPHRRYRLSLRFGFGR